MEIPPRPICKALFLLAALTLLLPGCGKVKMGETRYYAVYNEQGEMNVYRLNISAETHFTEGKYASGWYPKTSVDSLTGAINADQLIEDLRVRKAIEGEINEKVQEAYAKWLETAVNEESTQADCDKMLNTLRLVLSYPTRDYSKRKGMRYIEYLPTEGIVSLHADEKMVFMVSSDPTKVLNAINNFTQSTETAMTISSLGNLYMGKDVAERNQTLVRINTLQNNGSIIENKLTVLLESQGASDNTTRNARLAELISFTEMLKTMP